MGIQNGKPEMSQVTKIMTVGFVLSAGYYKFCRTLVLSYTGII